MKFIKLKKFGPADVLFTDECELPKIGHGQLLIKVNASGLNRADILQREGKYPAPKGESETLGLEVAGEVVEKCQTVNNFSIGERVFGLVAGGGYSEYVVINSEHAMRTPKNMTDVQAAGVAEAYLTAFQTLVKIGCLEAGQTALIHAAASGVGTAAIQIAKHIGAKVIATASSDEKLSVCNSLGADMLISYKSESFKTVLKNAGVSVDVVLDPVASHYVNDNLSVLNIDGKIVTIAMLGGRFVEGFDMAKMLQKRASIIGSTLRNQSDLYKASLVKDFVTMFGSELDNFSSSSFAPYIDKVYSFSDVADAHKYLESNQSIGKVVLTWT